MIKEAVLGNPLISVYRTTTRERTTKYVYNLWQTRLTWGSPDGGERRRPTLTRQNGKGNVASTSPKFCSPPRPSSRDLFPFIVPVNSQTGPLPHRLTRWPRFRAPH